MTAHVEHQSNGDVLLSRRFPKAQPGCPTIRLRWSATEWDDFVAGVRAGEFDAPEAPRSSETSADSQITHGHAGAAESRTAATVAPNTTASSDRPGEAA